MGSPAVALARLSRAALELGDRHRLYRVTAIFDAETEGRSEELAGPLVALFERARFNGVARVDQTPAALALAWGGLLLIALPEVAKGALSLDSATEFMLGFLLERPRASS
jgi:hypothetical protein